MPLHAHLGDVAWKSLFFYFFLLALLRVTGKREIGALNAIDLVGFIMISEAAIISIADNQIPFTVGVTPVIIIGALEWILAYLSLRDKRVRNLVEGEPSVLVTHGRINQRKLRQLRYNLSDLLAEMRAKNIVNIADVEFAVLETTGKLSIVPRAAARPLTPEDLSRLQVAGAQPASVLPAPELPAIVVMDGEVDEDALRRAGKDRAWLDSELRLQGHPPARRLLVAMLDGQNKLTVQAREKEEPQPPVATAAHDPGGDGADSSEGQDEATPPQR